MDRERAQVLIVGGGPTGLTAANLLGTMGLDVLLVEQNTTTSDEAKAISLDDESLRSLQLAGLDASIYEIIVPGTGTKYFGADGRPLIHARGGTPYRYGHPFKNPFSQPEFERCLLVGLDRFSNVDVRFATTLTGLVQDPDGVTTRVRSAEGAEKEIFVQYVLACDGGRSSVRELLSIPMSGTSFDDVWLVVDTLGDPHDQRYGMHHGDPDRPHVIVPGPDGRCRYEFRLHRGEAEPGVAPDFDLVRELVGAYREIEPHQVERAVSYRFHALLADRLRDGRCFLLGDAAHMMPPFAGQGLNSGLRDAVNLSWKVAQVLGGRADERLLDTYETERLPHARSMIELSVRLGRIVMTTSRARAMARDLAVRVASRTRRGRRYLSEMRFRPPNQLRAGALVRLPDADHQGLVGRVIDQPLVLHGPAHELVRLDEVLGDGWSLLGVDVSEAEWRSVAPLTPLPAAEIDVVLNDRSAREKGRPAVADADRMLEAALGAVLGHFILTRPDRVISAVFDAARTDEVIAGLEQAGLHVRAALGREPGAATSVR